MADTGAIQIAIIIIIQADNTDTILAVAKQTDDINNTAVSQQRIRDSTSVSHANAIHVNSILGPP